MLDLGDMSAANGDAHGIEANRLERIMLHEIATCDAAVAALLLGVHGFLGTSDLIEDLALLGALDGKLVYGSMNRGGLQGATFEMNDRMTGYDVRGVVDAGLDGGKMLLRINYEDPKTVDTISTCATAVNGLAELVELRLGFGVSRVLRQKTHGSMEAD